MEYTIQDLARSSGVSTRTLRYYDGIGLLVPQIRKINGRRYYGINEIIYLTQILSLKEFGFSLKKIKSILDKSSIYRVSILVSQKKVLIRELDRLKTSLQMIDSMIIYYQEVHKMDITQENAQTYLENFKNKQEYAKYFDETYLSEKSKEFENNFKLRAGNEYYDSFIKKSSQLSLVTAQDYGRRYGLFIKEINNAIESGLKDDSEEVQQLMKNQWEILLTIYPKTNSKRVYLAISDHLCKSPSEAKIEGIETFFDFLYKAMEVFAEKHFSEE